VERDLTLRRFERDLLIVWGGLTIGAFVATWGRADVAVGVAAGGALTAVSYLGIKGGADMLAAAVRPWPSKAAEAPDTAPGGQLEQTTGEEGADAAVPRVRVQRRVLVVAALKFLGRYALLALVAYGMLTRLRLHPVGILVGASAPVVAAAVQVIRLRRAAAPSAKSE